MPKRFAQFRSDDLAALLSISIALGFVALLCVLFEPVWETNDDVGMSMIAHGYGIAAQGSPTLVFSNVIWGVIVRSLPQIDGLLGYSLATLGCLVLAGSAFAYALIRSGAGLLIATLTLVLVLARAVIYPQFTLNAGYLTVAAVGLLLVYDRTRSIATLVAACALGFLGYLIRNHEFALVLFVALPILPWHLLRQRQLQIAAGALVVAVIAAGVADHFALSGPQWAYHWELNWPRAMFTDFRAGQYILQRPDVMERHGVSANDINLLGRWFFVDRQLANPALMTSILSDASFKSGIPFEASDAVTALQLAFAPSILPLTAVAIVGLVMNGRPRLWLSAILLIIVIGLFGAFGRALPRVITPIIALPVVVALSTTTLSSGWRRYVAIGALGIACISSLARLSGTAHVTESTLALAKHDRFVSPDATVVWGGAFPYEYIFPVFTRKSDTPNTRILALGATTFAPFSVGYVEENGDRPTIKRLTSPDGVSLVASDTALEMLRTYCREHHRSVLELAELSNAKAWTVRNAKCIKPI